MHASRRVSKKEKFEPEFRDWKRRFEKQWQKF